MVGMSADQPALPPSLLALPAYALSLAGRAARAGAIARVARMELRLGHVAARGALADLGGAVQRELGARLRQDPSDMVALLDALEGGGWVRRTPDPGDRRRKQVTLTAAGRRGLQRAPREVAG